MRKGSRVGRGVVGAGVGLFAGSSFSADFALGVGVGVPPFFFGAGDLSACGVGLPFAAGVFSDSAFFFAFGVGDFSEAGVGLPFLAGVFVASGVAVGLGVGDSSGSPGLVVAFGVLVGSGVGVPFAFALAFDVGVGDGFFFAFRFAGFGFAVGEGVTEGAGEVTARISSRAFFFFSSSVDCARTSVPRIAPTASAVPRKTRSRITAGERNRAEGVINSRKVSESRGLWHCLFGGGTRGGPFPFASQNRV